MASRIYNIFSPWIHHSFNLTNAIFCFPCIFSDTTIHEEVGTAITDKDIDETSQIQDLTPEMTILVEVALATGSEEMIEVE